MLRAGTAGVLYLAMGILGLALHVWCILLLFASHGFIAAMIGFCAPVFSELYICFRILPTAGWQHPFVLGCAAWIALGALVGIVVPKEKDINKNG